MSDPFRDRPHALRVARAAFAAGTVDAPRFDGLSDGERMDLENSDGFHLAEIEATMFRDGVIESAYVWWLIGQVEHAFDAK